MDRGAWWATVHGASESQTRLSDFTFFFSSFLSCLIKKMGRKHKNKIRGDKGETIKYRGSLKKLEIIFYLFAHVYLHYTVHTGFPNGSVKWTLYVWVIICLSVCSSYVTVSSSALAAVLSGEAAHVPQGHSHFPLLEQESANFSPGAKSSSLPIFLNNFLGTQPGSFSHIASQAAFVLQIFGPQSLK